MIITEPVAEVTTDASAAIGEAVRALAQRGGGSRYPKPAPNDYLQRWPLSKRVNSSKADADDATLVERFVSWPSKREDPAWGFTGSLNLEPEPWGLRGWGARFRLHQRLSMLTSKDRSAHSITHVSTKRQFAPKL